MDEVERTGREAVLAVTDAIASLSVPRGERAAGAPLAQLADRLLTGDCRAARLKAARGMQNFQTAVMMLRAKLVVALVDDQGLSFSEV
ncbi:MAG TPA: hypothetical protein VME46_01155, partial [Acidimicrobiales bacterium]|nr:hypothetical protein [Acidimicrobiales bacterium]